MLMKRLVPLALSSLAGYALWQWQARRHDQRHRTSHAKPEEVTTWEGEGGALHGSGPHMGRGPTRSAS
jgi:hypothetical protein